MNQANLEPFVKAIADLSQKAAGQEISIIAPEEGLAYPVIAVGKDIASLEAHLSQPVRKRLNKTVIDIPAFCAYVNDHKEPGTTIWASLSGGKFTAVIDGNHPGESGSPKWGDHVLQLDLQPDPDWVAWKELSGSRVTQDEFAQFLQDQAHTIEEPDAAKIRDIVLKFQATQVRSFKRPVFNEQNGSVQIAYDDETQQVGEFKLPEKLYIAVSPFRSSAPVTTEAALRFRFRDGAVAFGVHIVRPDKTEEEAFRQVSNTITEKTGLSVLLCK